MVKIITPLLFHRYKKMDSCYRCWKYKKERSEPIRKNYSLPIYSTHISGKITEPRVLINKGPPLLTKKITEK